MVPSEDSNDPNIIFSSELPATDNGAVSRNKYRVVDNADSNRIKTRVIVEPPAHSSVAREFLLVQGGLTREEEERFHRPRFPSGTIELKVCKCILVNFSANSRDLT